METREKTINISLMDVLWGIVENWKLIIAMAVFGVIVMAMYIVKSYDGLQADYDLKNKEYETTVVPYLQDKEQVVEYNSLPEDKQGEMAALQAEEWKASLTEEQLAAVDNAIATKKLLNEASEHQKDSILMNLDPYGVDTLYMVFEISAAGGQATIIANYVDYITGLDAVTELTDTLGWREEGKNDSVYSELITSAGINGTQFHVTVQYRNADDLSKAAEQIKNMLASKTTSIVSITQEHTLNCVENTVSNKVNNSLASSQNSLQQTITGYANQIISLTNTFKNVPNQLRLFNYLSDIEDGGNGYVKLDLPKEVIGSRPSAPSSKVTYLILGFIIGTVLGCVVVYVKKLFSTKLTKINELDAIYKLPILGTFNGVRRFKIDNLICSFKNRKSIPMDDAEAYELIATKLKATCLSNELKSIVFISNSANADDVSALEKISEQLKAIGINVEKIGNILMNKDVINASITDTAVVVVERVGKATYKDINSELTIAEGIGANVVGAIGIE